MPELPEFDAHRRVRGEARATGLWFSAHPLDAPELAGARRDAVGCADLPRLVGRRVALVGLTCAYRRVETKRGEPMLFVTIADETGLAEGTLFTRVYRAHGPAAHASVVRLEGRVEEALDAVTLNVDRVVALDGSASAPARIAAWDRGTPGGRDPSEAARVRGVTGRDEQRLRAAEAAARRAARP